MTRERYARMTGDTRRVVSWLPGGERTLLLPTLGCALIYAALLLWLFLAGDARLPRAILVPAACFLAATALRRLIGKQRPYDRYGLPPVGKHVPGKGRSLPSRHAASAAAIALAVLYASGSLAAKIIALVLALVVGALRVLCGQHDTVDVACAFLLSGGLSALGYLVL